MRLIITTLFILILLSIFWLFNINSSNIIIEWLDYHIEISTIFAFVVIVGVSIIYFILIYLLLFLKNIPETLKKHFQDKQDHDDLIFLLNSFSSLHTADITQINYYVKKINNHRNHPQMLLLKPLVDLFIAQSYNIEYQNNPKETEKLEAAYQELLQYENTKLYGLKGLVSLRIEKKRYNEALEYAEKAINIQPKSQQILQDLYKIYSSLELFENTQTIITKLLKYNYISEENATTLLIENYLNNAKLSILDSKISNAISLLEKALKLDKSHFDTIDLLSKLYFQNNSKKLAYKIIEKAWDIHPSSSIIDLLLEISNQEPLNKKIKLIENLINLRPDYKEGYLSLTKIYINENNLNEARKTMDKFLSSHAPDSNTSKIMALIETKAHNNHSVIANWLQKI